MTALLVAQGCTCATPAKESASKHDTASATPDAPATSARGMWVWRTGARLADPAFEAALLETCRRARLNEVYLSVGSGALDDARLPALVTALHGAGVRVEALMGDAAWYQPDKRTVMLASVGKVGAYNEAHPAARFAGVHLDIEPHQLAENRRSHDFLPALAEALKAASNEARKQNLSTSADLPRFALDEQGPQFARAVGRPFVMLYELRDKSAERLTAVSSALVATTYAGVGPEVRGRLVVGLSVGDYPSDLDARLAGLDAAQGKDPRYGGWAIHDDEKYRARPATQ